MWKSPSIKKIRKSKKIGLALGGGVVLGAAHIGVLKAFEKYNISVSCIAGTSIGALVSAFYAFGRGWEEIYELAKDLKWLDVSGVTLSQYGLLSNKKLGRLITENLGDVAFDEADIPLAVIATDITSGEKVVLNQGKVAPAVMASACIPGIFIPVEINDRLLVDGGLVENVPVSPLKHMGADLIISVDVNSEYKRKKPKNIIEVLLRSFDLSIKTATALQTEKTGILIKPDLSAFNMVDIDQTDDLIEAGYLAANKILGKVT
jgi:NTE family protein